MNSEEQVAPNTDDGIGESQEVSPQESAPQEVSPQEPPSSEPYGGAVTAQAEASQESAPQESAPQEPAPQEPAVSTPLPVPNGAVSARPKNTMQAIEAMLLEEQNNFSHLPKLHVGDTVRVFVRIREGAKERLQPYEGVIIAFKHGGHRETMMVRRISFGVSVERIFPLHSPYVSRIEVLRHGRVRRAKLYYLRGRFGKAAKIREKVALRQK